MPAQLDPVIWNLSDVNVGDFDQPFAEAAHLAAFVADPENFAGECYGLRVAARSFCVGVPLLKTEEDWRRRFSLITHVDPSLAYLASSADMLRDAVTLLSERPDLFDLDSPRT